MEILQDVVMFILIAYVFGIFVGFGFFTAFMFFEWAGKD